MRLKNGSMHWRLLDWIYVRVILVIPIVIPAFQFHILIVVTTLMTNQMRRLTCNCYVKKNNEKTPAPLRQREMNIGHWQPNSFLTHSHVSKVWTLKFLFSTWNFTILIRWDPHKIVILRGCICLGYKICIWLIL